MAALRRIIAITLLVCGFSAVVSHNHVAAVSSVQRYLTDPVDNADAANLAEAIILNTQTLPGYAGVAIIATGIGVYYASDDQALQSAVTAVIQSNPAWSAIPVTFTSVTYSWQTLEDAISRINSDRQEWVAQGVPLSSWGISVTSNEVQITEEHYSASDAALLSNAYGAIVTVLPENITFNAGYSRTNDNQPWTGADKITLDSGEYCTDWFSTLDNTDGYGTMLTAGHCGAGDWQTGGGDHTTVTPSGIHWVDGGTVDVERTGNQGYQTNHVWTDPGPTTRNVTAVAGAFAENTIVCFDGAITKENCSASISNPDATITENVGSVSKTLYHQVTTDGYDQCRHGDSGGPVYSNVYASGGGASGYSTVKAYGMFIAGSIGSNSDPVPGSHCIFTPADSVLDAFAVVLDIKTS